MRERAEVQENVIVTKEGHYEFYRESRGVDILKQTITPLEFYTTRWIGDNIDMRKKYEEFYARVYADLMFNIFNKSNKFGHLNVNLSVCDPKDIYLDSNNHDSTLLIEKYGYKIELIISEFKKIMEEKPGFISLEKKSPYKYYLNYLGVSSIEFSFKSTLPMDGSDKEFLGNEYYLENVANMFIFDYDYIHNITNGKVQRKYMETIFTPQVLKVYTDKYLRCIGREKLDNILNCIIIEDDKYSYPFASFVYRDFYKLEDSYTFINRSKEYVIFNYIKNENAKKEFMQKLYNESCDYSKASDNSVVTCFGIVDESIGKEKIKKIDYSKWLLDIEKEFDEIKGSEKNVMRRCQLLEMMSTIRQFIKEEREKQALNSCEEKIYPCDLTCLITNEQFLSKNNIVYSNHSWNIIYGTRYEQKLTLNIFGDPNKPKDNDIFIIENFVEKQYEILIYKSGKFLFTSNMCEECTMDILEGFEYRGKLYSFELIKTNLIVKRFYRNIDKFTIIF